MLGAWQVQPVDREVRVRDVFLREQMRVPLVPKQLQWARAVQPENGPLQMLLAVCGPRLWSEALRSRLQRQWQVRGQPELVQMHMHVPIHGGRVQA